MARDFRRQLDSAQNFSANSPVSFELPRDSVYKEILLHLEMNLTTAAGGALDGFFDGFPWTLLKRIELIADGKDTIKSIDGASAVDLNWFDYGTFPDVEESTLGAAADGGNQEFLLMLPLESIGMLEPMKTYHDARKNSSLELRLTFGAGAADLASTATNVTIATYRITPYAQEILDLGIDSRFAVNQEILQNIAFPTNTGTDRRFRLNVGNAYRQIMVDERDQNSRAKVDRITEYRLIENGTFTRRRWPKGLLKLHNDMKLIAGGGGLALGDAPTMPDRASGAATPATGRAGGKRTGLAMIDIAEDGREDSMIDTLGFSDLSLHLDWNGANVTDLIRIVTRQWVPTIR